MKKKQSSFERHIRVSMTRAAYNSLFAEGERKIKSHAIEYLNDTGGYLGTVVDIVIED